MLLASVGRSALRGGVLNPVKHDVIAPDST